MTDDSDFLITEDEEETSDRRTAALEPWHILIVDDDPEVHAVTRLSLRRFCFEERPVDLISAFSAAEARDILGARRDIALILLDVVMETEDAGLRFVRHVRETLGNSAVRIILRTGQPGSAPEQQVIVDFDINDYRAKTELTHERLTVCTITALRSYRDIRTVEANNHALHKIAESAAGMFRSNLMHQFLDYVLKQAVAVIEASTGTATGAVFCVRQTNHVTLTPEISVVAGCGRFAGATGLPVSAALAPDEAAAVEAATISRRHTFAGDHIVLSIQVPGRWSGAVLLPVAVQASESLAALVQVFVTIMTAALDNVYLMEELRRSNKATVVALADLAENRDTDTGEHVLRVARLTGEIARELERRSHPDLGDPLFVEQVGLASMLHDLGKVGIPDEILKKKGRLDPQERTVMETHTLLGGRTLEKARKVVSGNCCYLTLGWEIATGHHEAYDGSGYPHRLKGREIPLSARIVAVADVFDALTSRRPYKKAWPVQDAIAYIVERSGGQFDPTVVDAFLYVLSNRAGRSLICWSDEMSVGDADIDNDHQMLIDLINQLATADACNDRASAEFVIDELIQYTMQHFAREEDLLERLGYPDLAAHMGCHISLSRQVLALRERFFNGFSGRLSGDILDFLSTWLSNHILREDLRYAPLIRARADARAAP
ncbi:MAG: bacteriohemerythrin [Rhodospirillaceae bacterium]